MLFRSSRTKADFEGFAFVVAREAQVVMDAIGAGHAEAVYQSALRVSLDNYSPRLEEPVPVYFKEVCVGVGRADLFIPGQRCVLELKVVSRLNDAHRAQLCAYLRGLKMPFGMLLNFSIDGTVQCESVYELCEPSER